MTQIINSFKNAHDFFSKQAFEGRFTYRVSDEPPELEYNEHVDPEDFV